MGYPGRPNKRSQREIWRYTGIPRLSDSYFKQWKTAQGRYLIEAETAFHPLPLKKLRRFPSEVKGLKLLAELGSELFGDEDPSQVYFEGKAIKVTELEQGIEVVVPIPFASKDVCEVERMGEDLSVVISTDIGEVRNFIPLPAIAQMMTLEKAKLLNGELHIYFIDERWEKEK
jgi:arsenite-transporting ATPase